MIYDEESMIKDLVSTLQAELNNEITKINIEKNASSGDELFLEPIQNDEYIFEVLDDSVNNYKGFFLMYGLIDMPLRETSEDNAIEEVVLAVRIGTFDNGEKGRKNILYKLLRYRKALKQLFKNNPDMFQNYAKPIVASLKPDAFNFGNKRIIIQAGVNVKASITAN